MAPTEVRVTITRAMHLKNVNRRSGALRPYVVAWIDSATKSSTRVAVYIDSDEGGVNAAWDGEALAILLPQSLPTADAVLSIHVVHAAAAGDDVLKPLVGSARLPLRDLLDDSYGAAVPSSLKLKRPSGRPQGKIEVEVAVRDSRNYAPPAPRPTRPGFLLQYVAHAAWAPPQYAAGVPPQYATAAWGAPPQYAPAAWGAPPQYAAGAPSQYAAGAPPQYAAEKVEEDVCYDDDGDW